MTGYSASSADYVRARNTHKTTSRIRDSFSIEFVLPSVQREFRVKLLKLSGCPWHESVLLPVHKTASWNHVLGITRIKSIPSSPDSSFPMRQDCICWQNPNRCPGNRPGASTGPGQLADEGGSSSGFVWVAVRWSTCITFRARVSPWLAGQADRDWLGDVTCYDCRMSRWPPGRGRLATSSGDRGRGPGDREPPWLRLYDDAIATFRLSGTQAAVGPQGAGSQTVADIMRSRGWGTHRDLKAHKLLRFAWPQTSHLPVGNLK